MTSASSWNSVSMLKFGSNARGGGGLVGVPPAWNTGVFFTVTDSARGPPGGCVSEYTCHPPSISAVAVAVSVAPGLITPAGATLSDQCTGVCANAGVAAHPIATAAQPRTFGIRT